MQNQFELRTLNIMLYLYYISATLCLNAFFFTDSVVMIKDLNDNVIGKYTLVLPGDVNSDGDVSLQDYGKIKTHTKPNGNQKITNIYQYSAADFNLDGSVSLQDYGKIKTFTKPKV